MNLDERMLEIFYEALHMVSNTNFPKLNAMDSDGVRVYVRKCVDLGTEKMESSLLLLSPFDYHAPLIMTLIFLKILVEYFMLIIMIIIIIETLD